MPPLKPMLLIVVLISLMLTQHTIANDMRSVLFNELDAELALANATQASILSPKLHAKAKDHYDSANKRFEEGQKIEKIKKDIAKAKEYFQKSNEATMLAQTTLAPLIRTRSDAIRARAEDFTPSEWQKAEEAFLSTTAQLEKGKTNSIERLSDKAIALYKKAELTAIKTNYLNETRDLLAQAKKDKVSRYAPLTLAKAEKLLNKAEKILSENRYDIDEPRALAREAIYEARHAKRIADQVKATVKKETTVEQIILAMEEPIVRIAGTLNLTAEFDDTVKDPTARIHEIIRSLQKDAYELTERRNEIAVLEKEIARMELRLGVQSERLAKQELRNQKIAKLESIFVSEEAIVLKKGDSIILRMVGLNFDPGKSTINTENFNLLRKVQEAINLFPNSDLIIEGHTDSFGSDTLNLQLSQDRAMSVQAYLLANIPKSENPLPIVAKGYGEARPIGNNETIEGRKKNRRIDLIISNK